MGLQSIAAAAARVGFSVAGDSKIEVTIKTGPTAVHDVATDLSTISWTHTTPVTVIAYDSGEKESKSAEGPKKREKTLLIQAADLPAAPTEESVAVIDGDDWNVASVATDPAGATHELIVRR